MFLDDGTCSSERDHSKEGAAPWASAYCDWVILAPSFEGYLSSTMEGRASAVAHCSEVVPSWVIAAVDTCVSDRVSMESKKKKKRVASSMWGGWFHLWFYFIFKKGWRLEAPLLYIVGIVGSPRFIPVRSAVTAIVSSVLPSSLKIRHRGLNEMPTCVTRRRSQVQWGVVANGTLHR